MRDFFIVISATALVYLVFAFVIWNLDPSYWKEEARLGAALLWVGGTVISVLYDREMRDK